MELPAAIPAEPSWADKVGDFPLGPRAISLAELHGADDLVGSEVHLRDEDLAGNNEQWQWCVVGKLLGVHLDTNFVLSATLFQFRRRYGIDVMKIAENVFFIKFSCKEATPTLRLLPLDTGGGQMLLAEDWHPTASLSSSNVHPVRLWLTLPNLPSI